MKRIKLYYQGVLVTYHPLTKGTFSIGTQPDNDLVLAGDPGLAYRAVVFRSSDGTWQMRSMCQNGCNMDPVSGTNKRVVLGPFSIELESQDCKSTDLAEPGTEALPAELGIVGISTQTRLLRMDIERLARLNVPVLVTGETGTGKELVARGLHCCSNRSSRPFIPVNCGGLTSTLMEDTLFGHDRGAFTGALTKRRGVFEQAHGGTLFLDEIGEMPLAQQAALLRVLDDQQVRRIGSEHPTPVDFRLIAATNRDLSALIAKGTFRLDLFHRIAALQIKTLPLRDRPGDIELLATHFLAQMAKEVGLRRLDRSAVVKLASFSWPGNARELKNALYRAAAMTRSDTLKGAHFELCDQGRKPKRQAFCLDALSDARLEEMMARHRGNVAAAARALGIPRTSLRDRLKRQSRQRDLTDTSTHPISLAS
ncbi:MAG: sigma-54 dependent transcriptional regulator [Myxococcota bacterium]|nr:sigma-54 dependent transcriptional regulator [Myxococcota bacterium]